MINTVIFHKQISSYRTTPSLTAHGRSDLSKKTRTLPPTTPASGCFGKETPGHQPAYQARYESEVRQHVQTEVSAHAPTSFYHCKPWSNLDPSPAHAILVRAARGSDVCQHAAPGRTPAGPSRGRRGARGRRSARRPPHPPGRRRPRPPPLSSSWPACAPAVVEPDVAHRGRLYCPIALPAASTAGCNGCTARSAWRSACQQVQPRHSSTAAAQVIGNGSHRSGDPAGGRRGGGGGRRHFLLRGQLLCVLLDERLATGAGVVGVHGRRRLLLLALRRSLCTGRTTPAADCNLPTATG